MRTQPLLVVVLGVLGSSDARPAPAADNVLVILADDLGVTEIGTFATGASPAPTPNLDALAANGVAFHRAWSQPVCSPTRAAVSTGLDPRRLGIGDVITGDTQSFPSTQLTLPDLVAQGTGGLYRLGAFGKWHLANSLVEGLSHPNDCGWSHFSGTMTNLGCGSMNAGIPGFCEQGGAVNSFNWPLVEDGEQLASTTYATTATVDAFLAWHATLDGAPWIAWLAPHAPHAPFQVPPSELHSFDALPPGALAPPDQRRALYEAMIEALDTEIGRLITSLGPEELARTHIIFLGDNGTPAPVAVEPFAADRAKGTVYEGGVHVPLVVAGPAVTAPGNAFALVHVVDVYEGNAGTFDVPGAPPGATVWIVASTSLAPLPFGGGLLAPTPVEGLQAFGADQSGSLALPVPGASIAAGGYELYVQAVAADPAQPSGWALSNALRVEWPAANTRDEVVAVRNGRYKLIRVVYANVTTLAYGSGPVELLYDLAADPFETTDLLMLGPLDPDDQQAYDQLAGYLDELFPP